MQNVLWSVNHLNNSNISNNDIEIQFLKKNTI